MDKSILSLQDKNIWVFGGAGYLHQLKKDGEVE